MNDGKKLSQMETFFLALADGTRLRLLNLMRGEEICVGLLIEALDENQPKISRHLACLRGAGIVETRREGKWMHYRIAEPEDDSAKQVLQDTLVWLSSQPAMREEYQKLSAICSSADNAMTINRQTKSNTFAKTDMKTKQNRELEIFLL